MDFGVPKFQMTSPNQGAGPEIGASIQFLNVDGSVSVTQRGKCSKGVSTRVPGRAYRHFKSGRT